MDRVDDMDDVEQKQKQFFVHIVHSVHIVHNDFRNLAVNPKFPVVLISSASQNLSLGWISHLV